MIRTFARRLARTSVLGGIAALAFATMFIASGATAHADPQPTSPTVTDASPMGYFVWHNDDGWHLRTHGPGAEHLFTARLHTDGVFTDVDRIRFEDRDHAVITDDGHTMLLRFHTYNGIDSVNFRIRGSDDLRLRLELNGELISTDDIHIGVNGRHPADNPFTLDRDN